MTGKQIVFSGLLAGWLLGTATLASAVPLEPFRRLVVLDQGRQKPLDTFARNLLKQFSGRASLAGMDAGAWLAGVFFTPERTFDYKIFLVNQPDVLAAIGVNGEGRGRYSFAQLRPGMDRLHELAFQHAGPDGGSPGRVEAEAQRLFYNISTYYSLLGAFPASLAGNEMNMDPRGLPELPAIVPPASGGDEAWLSPIQALARNASLPAVMRREISWLSQAARAYAGDNGSDFARALIAFNISVKQRLGARALAGSRISMELFYNRLDPFFKAELAYGLGLLFLLFSLAVRRTWLERLSLLCLLLGFLPHSFGMAARMWIMNRPPVTNLYETFVFVAWAGTAMGLLMAWWRKKGLGILAGGLAGLVFLVIAGRYAMDGDTMGMLAAVLDSNLWLATHVVTISLGYAGCVVAGIIGHVVIIQELLEPRSAAAADTASTLYAALAFGLSFTAIGTVMGGIWADQSWGRFWGWDPKENGALLIILWCAVLFHARLAGWIGHIGLAAGSIGAIVAVALAWFGVNLLGVGMHAYGFTSGAARGLAAFSCAELLFLALSLPLVKKRSRPQARQRKE
jgi:ABC-type transport system involved in cytochrome c biogenesis permease subunit